MSRIGRAPIPVPPGVDVTIEDGTVTVKGPKGELFRKVHPDMRVNMEDSQIVVARPTDSSTHRSLHGLTRTLIANMVTGVTLGYRKTIEIIGVGYRAQKQGDKLVLTLGFSHPVEIIPPPGIEVVNVETFTPTAANEWLSSRFTIAGINKETVGQLAANIRKLRKAEPYKGKGLKYSGEKVRRKAGKSAGKAGKGK